MNLLKLKRSLSVNERVLEYIKIINFMKYGINSIKMIEQN